MKGNIHKKTHREDKFARRYFCKHARMGWLREDKRQEPKAWRKFMKQEQKQQEDER